ncbi:hypothetical protein ACHAWF_016457 [Thalassiosira exigua]
MIRPAILMLAAAKSPDLALAFPQPRSTAALPTSPVCRRNVRNDVSAMRAKRRRRKASSEAEDADDSRREIDGGEGATEGTPRQTTLSGGTPLIFEMARRMLVWDDELYESQILNDAGSRAGGEAAIKSPPSSASDYLTTLTPPAPAAPATSVPRWRPSAIRRRSISNVNPSFRTSSPIMTNAGYAVILRRNSRKKNKPSLWRHCLRVYSKMGELENNGEVADREGNKPADDVVDRNQTTGSAGPEASQIPGVGNNLAAASSLSRGAPRRKKNVKRSTVHHEAALVAASKLGTWEEALLIYRRVEESSMSNGVSVAGESPANAGTTSNEIVRRGKSRVTDNMILSVISACVKGSKVKQTTSSSPTVNVNDDGNGNALNSTDAASVTESSNATSMREIATPPPSRPMFALTVEERRRPLDIAREIILSMEEKHDIPLVSRHINPLASAYVRLGLRSEAAELIKDHLKDRAPPPSQQNLSSKQSKQRKEKGELTSENPGFEGVPLVDWRDDDLVDDGDEAGDNNDGYEDDVQLNVHQIKSKDRGSYSLLVQGAAMEGDWAGAVKELQRMTDAGFHPNTRNLNSWSEVMERGCRPSGNGNEEEGNGDGPSYYGGGRRRRSWKKRRDDIWLGNLR